MDDSFFTGSDISEEDKKNITKLFYDTQSHLSELSDEELENYMNSYDKIPRKIPSKIDNIWPSESNRKNPFLKLLKESETIDPYLTYYEKNKIKRERFMEITLEEIREKYKDNYPVVILWLLNKIENKGILDD